MSQQTEIIKAEPASVVNINRTPMELINLCVERGQGLDQLSKLMELHQDYERYEAEKAFFKAMAGFQADPPEVFKNKSVAFGKTKYEHATLDHVVDEIRAKMKSHGLTFIWDLDDLDNGTIRCTCVIRHELGHATRVAMSAPPDTSGQKNTVQSRASTVTYLQRYTLLAATGVAPKDQVPDMDGKPLDAPKTMDEADAKTTEDFFKKLRARLKKLKLTELNFCIAMQVDSRNLEDLPRTKWDAALKRCDDRQKYMNEKKKEPQA